MAVSVEELAGSPTFSFDRQGGSGKRVFILDWADIYTFLLELMPSSFLSGTDIIVPPAASFPGLPWLYAKSADVGPWDGESPLGQNETPAAYSKAQVTVSYATEEFDQKTNQANSDGPGGNQGSTGGSAETFVSHKVSVSGEFLTWPAQSLRFDSPSDPTSSDSEGREKKVPEDAMVGVIIPSMEHQITWHHVPFPPWAVIRLAVGCVNAYFFAGAPPETALFLGAEAQREITNEGVRAWQLDYKINEKNNNPFDVQQPMGWNHFLRPDGYSGGQFEIVNRRAPGGHSTLSADILDSDTTIPVQSRSTFPIDNGIPVTIEIGNEWIDTSNNVTASQFEGVSRGANNTAAGAASKGDVVRQVLFALSENELTTTSVAVTATDVDVFPAVGQFFVRLMPSASLADVGSREVALCWRIDRSTRTLYLLRGVRGETPKAHPAASYIQMLYSPVYPLLDLRLLFLSGLLTG